MTVQTKKYVVRLALWLAAIVVVAWPLHLARSEIGNIAYIASAAVVLAGCYWLGILITKHIGKAR
ncbi:hypothetical protein [Luteimonas suaedae]|uniref:hypothetical protein n=1 Tax=Luteimonas suaedae TaxID=2605430 RepID=UPI0011EFC50E|nr:hypothetical protein [Luteimonas suaedae]